MKRSIWIIAPAVFVLFTGFSLAAPNMEDGLWEITTTVDMPGMPAKSFTHTTCLTKDKTVPQKSESGCTVKDMKTQGNVVTWTAVCSEGMSTSKGKVTYAGTTMEGAVETTVKANERTMTMKSKMKGKRIGPCK